MKIIKVAKNKENDFKKMKEFFIKRTKKHINLVGKYLKKIEEYDENLFSKMTEQEEWAERAERAERVKDHDKSKFEEPELTPYVYITWKYKCQDEGKEFNVPKEIEEKMTEAKEHHVKNNPHHPEYHCNQTENLINENDRDKPPNKMIDGTKMKKNDIAEMIADWCAVSEEKGNNPKSWADKNINVRWKFTNEQSNLIYQLIDSIWEK